MVWVGGDTPWQPLADWHVANGGTGDEEWVPAGERIKWTVTYYVPNDSDPAVTWTCFVLKDRFGAELNHVDAADPVPWPAPVDPAYPYSTTGPAVQDVIFEYSKAKNMPQFRVTWKVCMLEPGEQATLSFDVVTRLNPADHQEYTSCGLHILNSGASLKWKVGGICDDCDEKGGWAGSKSTPSWYVMVWDGECENGECLVGAIIGWVTEDGNPVEGAIVELSTGETATTDKFGWYYFSKVDATCAGVDYEVWLQPLLDPGDKVPVTVYAGQITEQNFPSL
jgi:hypothetical protein